MTHSIKDCSNCLIPHKPNGYDYINKKIGQVNEERIMKEFGRDKKD